MMLTLALLLICPIICLSQKVEKFYDWRWKETDISFARFYAVIEKTDSGWNRSDFYIRENRLQMQGRYADQDCKVALGKFYYFHPNGNLLSTGTFVDGKKEGVWLAYYSDGSLSDSTTHHKDNKVGTSLTWHHNGYLSDSAVFTPDGRGVAFAWFDNGNPSLGGVYTSGYNKIGKWQYFHKNGQVSAIEI